MATCTATAGTLSRECVRPNVAPSGTRCGHQVVEVDTCATRFFVRRDRPRDQTAPRAWRARNDRATASAARTARSTSYWTTGRLLTWTTALEHKRIAVRPGDREIAARVADRANDRHAKPACTHSNRESVASFDQHNVISLFA